MNSKEMWGRVKSFLDEACRYVDDNQLSVGLGAAGAGALGARALTGSWKYAPHGAALGWFGTRGLSALAPKRPIVDASKFIEAYERSADPAYDFKKTFPHISKAVTDDVARASRTGVFGKSFEIHPKDAEIIRKRLLERIRHK